MDGGIFDRLGSDGNTVDEHQFGLLLYRGGTVCNDGFDDIAAEAICRQIHSSYTVSKWTSGIRYNFQYNIDIKLDDIQCGSADWESCEYSSQHNCEHSEDVYLFCAASEESLSGTISILD